MDDAGPNDRLGPDLSDGIGQAFQPVADQHEGVLGAAVHQLGQDPEPVLGAFASLAAGQQPRMSRWASAVAFSGDREGRVDATVGDLAVADSDVDVDAVAEDETTGWTRSGGRACDSVMPSHTESVFVEMVCLETSALWAWLRRLRSRCLCRYRVRR